MDNYKTEIITPQALDIITTTRAMGYTTESAVADIIDNSIAAGANRIEIFFPPEASYIKISDDGCGMNYRELIDAMRYGKNPEDERKTTDLGRFGLGLKTASFSQCEKLTVISKKNNIISGLRWDPLFLKNNHSAAWAAIVIPQAKATDYISDSFLNCSPNGTMVIWENLSLMLAGESNPSQSLSLKMDSVRAHISLVFHRFLAGEDGLKKLTITINNKILTPRDPFLKKKSTRISQTQKIEVPELTNKSITVEINKYLLPSPSKITTAEREMICGKTNNLISTQGFYVYRNKRLLVWATWFKLAPKKNTSQLSRIQIDIPSSMDKLWSLDVKKSSAKPPEIIRKSLKSLIDYSMTKSKKTFQGKSSAETNPEYSHFWNRIINPDESISFSLNKENPMIVEFSDKLSGKEQKSFSQILYFIEQFIPINTMLVDMEEERELHFDDDERIKEEVEKKATDLLDITEDRKIIDILEKSEPFVKYPEIITKLLKERNLI